MLGSDPKTTILDPKNAGKTFAPVHSRIFLEFLTVRSGNVANPGSLDPDPGFSTKILKVYKLFWLKTILISSLAPMKNV